MSHRIAAIAVAIVASYALVTGQQGPPPPRDAVPDELLVQFRPEIPEVARANMLAASGTDEIRRFDALGIAHVRVRPGRGSDAALAALRAAPGVTVAGPNNIRYAVRIAAPNDPYWVNGTLWNIARIQSLEAWNAFGPGDGNVVVADLDTGVDYNHPDLAANMWRNPTEIPGNQIDDDGNGWIDDVYGIDTHFRDGDPMDDLGHGTIVAGVMAGVGNNGIGVVGVGWRTKILACKFLGPSGSGTDADAIACFNYVLLQKSRGVNIVATNNSWGSNRWQEEPQSPLKAAMDAVGAAGILNVCAAGNSAQDNDAVPFDPASFSSPTIISVAASDAADARPSFSSYGATTVDLAAPGVGIVSTYPRAEYAGNTGTSLATPHVAGAAALIASIFPTLPAAGVKAAIMNGVDVLPAWTGVVASGGRLNVHRALTLAAGNLQPEVSITQPMAGAPFQAPATIAIAATASDPDGTIARVEFFADGQSIGVDTTSPYGGQWPGVGPGAYTLTAVATDNEGGTRTSAGVQIFVFTQPRESLHSNQTPVAQNYVGNFELGVRVISNVAGKLTAIRFWKGTEETGTHVGRVWTSTGQLLASVTFANETASGWQEQPLPAHVAMAAETVYVVSVSSGGRYASTSGFFATPLANGHLRTAPGANGVYGNAGTFPTDTYSSTNYFRDLVFVADGGGAGDVTPPTVAITAPANASTVSGLVTISANASDNVGVTGVQFLAPGLNVTDATAPYSVTWDSALATNGLQTITAIARDAAGNQASHAISVTVNNGGGAGGQTLFTTQTPAADTYVGNWELGMRVISDAAGQFTRLRFWKSPGETGTHVGRVWSSAGQLLASVTFTGETASGWQEQALPTPVAVAAETVYVISVSTGGRYAATVGFFNSPVVNGHLRAAPAPNGLYGNVGTFPTDSYSATNYFRDVVFVLGGGAGDVTPPTVAITAPANGSTVTGLVTISANASDNVGVTSVQFVAPGLNVTDATAPYSVTWDSALATNGLQTITAIARDAAGNQNSHAITVTVNNAGGAAGQTLLTTQTPAADNYVGSWELGMRVISSVAGQFTAVRFWKSPEDTGTHVGRIWSSTGQLLASVIFTNETASGWQEQALPTPVAVAAETIYVVSVSTGGRYAATVGFFNSPVVNGHLRAAPAPNGLYGNLGTFPTDTYSATNYFRDVRFVPN
jgi:subtilisin family serine protease